MAGPATPRRGETHLSAIESTLDGMGLLGLFPIAALAKREESLHMRGKETILLDRKGRALVHARDEAHRFSNAFHKKRRGKGALADPLEEVDGLGAKKIQALLRHFGGRKGIEHASVKDLRDVRDRQGDGREDQGPHTEEVAWEQKTPMPAWRGGQGWASGTLPEISPEVGAVLDVAIIPQTRSRDPVGKPMASSGGRRGSPGAKRLARMGEVSGIGRESGVEMLLGDDDWVVRRESGVDYGYRMTRCMFSSGNVNERRRMGEVTQRKRSWWTSMPGSVTTPFPPWSMAGPPWCTLASGTPRRSRHSGGAWSRMGWRVGALCTRATAD